MRRRPSPKPGVSRSRCPRVGQSARQRRSDTGVRGSGATARAGSLRAADRVGLTPAPAIRPAPREHEDAAGQVRSEHVRRVVAGGQQRRAAAQQVRIAPLEHIPRQLAPAELHPLVDQDQEPPRDRLVIAARLAGPPRQQAEPGAHAFGGSRERVAPEMGPGQPDVILVMERRGVERAGFERRQQIHGASAHRRPPAGDGSPTRPARGRRCASARRSSVAIARRTAPCLRTHAGRCLPAGPEREVVQLRQRLQHLQDPLLHAHAGLDALHEPGALLRRSQSRRPRLRT